MNVVHRGQHTEIWQAYHDGEQERYCLKTLAMRSRRNREHLRYLRWEANMMEKVAHPRVIATKGFHVDRGRPYLVMEWWAAPNMKSRIRLGITSIMPLVPRIVEEAAEGLGHVHDMGFVHRDVKPENFLVDDEGEVKLIDFALAHQVRGPLARLLAGRPKVQGTRSYIAPEQIRRVSPMPSADVYSFGCTAFELLAGRPPFTASSAKELLSKHLRSAPPLLTAVNKDVTPEFAELIRSCMAKDPSKRPQTMSDFRMKLRGMRIFRNISLSSAGKDKQ
jgi:serine/threonine protein kinase